MTVLGLTGSAGAYVIRKSCYRNMEKKTFPKVPFKSVDDVKEASTKSRGAQRGAGRPTAAL